jgi:DNA-binding transcriptional LysR family regulator
MPGAHVDWDKLKTFHFAAETGSLTHAADKLGVSQSAVSRQIAALEEAIGVPLFQRHARGLMLTPPGQALKDLTDEMAGVAARAESRLADARDKVSGELTVTAPVAFGTTWLAPRLGGFAEKFPELRTRLLLEDREYDLLKLEAECAVRLWPSTQADVIQRKLGEIRTHLYASPGYLETHPEPIKPEDVDKHRIVSYYNAEAVQLRTLDWALHVGREDEEPRAPALIINNLIAVMRAVVAGFGIGALPDYMARDRPELVRLLPDVEGPRFDVYFVYPRDLKGSQRIVALREFLVKEAQSWQG